MSVRGFGAIPSGVVAAVLVLSCGSTATAQVAVIAPPKVGGYVQVRETAQKDVGLTATLNRARVSVDGALPSKFGYRFLVEFQTPAGARNPATPSLREAMIRWSPGALTFTGGQFKTPFSREYLVPVPSLETADFAAVVDSLSPKYDVGLMAEYAFGPFASLYAGAFNGEGANATVNRDSLVLIVARGVVRPVAPLALGLSVARDGSDSVRWGVEASVEQLGGTVRAEYITRHRSGRARDRDDEGWYVLALYRIVPIAQAVVRQEHFERPASGIARRVQATTVGAIVDVAPRMRLIVNGVRRNSGSARHADTYIAQLQARF